MRDDEFEAYAAADFVSNSFMHAVAGVKSCNSTADFRTWWEVPQAELGSLAAGNCCIMVVRIAHFTIRRFLLSDQTRAIGHNSWQTVGRGPVKTITQQKG